ncbi:MAG TPA: hypothetical protein VKK06_24655 [Terriglobia bacterium]|nr:hypothetical protein [Terriglobia bacterium]
MGRYRNSLTKKRIETEQLRVNKLEERCRRLDEKIESTSLRLAIRSIFNVADERLQQEVMGMMLTAFRNPRKHTAILREFHLLLERPDVRALIKFGPR